MAKIDETVWSIAQEESKYRVKVSRVFSSFDERRLCCRTLFTGTDLLPSTPGAVELQQAADEETQG